MRRSLRGAGVGFGAAAHLWPGNLPSRCSQLIAAAAVGEARDQVSICGVVVAAGEGAKAALQAHRYLQRLSE